MYVLHCCSVNKGVWIWMWIHHCFSRKIFNKNCFCPSWPAVFVLLKFYPGCGADKIVPNTWVQIFEIIQFNAKIHGFDETLMIGNWYIIKICHYEMKQTHVYSGRLGWLFRSLGTLYNYIKKINSFVFIYVYLYVIEIIYEKK